MATVSLSDVTKHVGSNIILNKISISINEGEFVVVVGPSGCGKSTLLRSVAGLENINSGKILINDRCINHIAPAKRDMAMVFQHYALYPHMTAFDNMAYGLKMRRMNKEDITRRVKAVANMLQLTPYLDRKPQALSGGQKQRVAMGRAIVRSPAVYLFDEPLSNLDAKLRTEMRHEIKKIHKTFKTTSLYVTHDQTEAMTLADRVLVLNQGLIEQIGTPQQLYQFPATLFVAEFTGHYPMNVFSASYDKVAGLINTPLGVSYPAPDCMRTMDDKSQLMLAIRPEHIALCEESHPKAIAIKPEFVDDMGADKLIQAKNIQTGESLIVRVSSGQILESDNMYVQFPVSKLHLFLQETGKRIGEWNETNN